MSIKYKKERYSIKDKYGSLGKVNINQLIKRLVFSKYLWIKDLLLYITLKKMGNTQIYTTINTKKTLADIEYIVQLKIDTFFSNIFKQVSSKSTWNFDILGKQII